MCEAVNHEGGPWHATSTICKNLAGFLIFTLKTIVANIDPCISMACGSACIERLFE